MLIKTITLENVGAYENRHQLSLNTTGDQNTILIGGRNGAGKTTLLESIRLAFFGPLAYGYKSMNQSYKDEIYSLLNTSALRREEKDFSLQIEFTQTENYEDTTYKILRKWQPKLNNNIQEIVYVYKNDSLLNERETEDFQSKLRSEIPPQLFELSFFDGEEIGRIVDEGELPDYLHQLSRVLFHLNLFESLEEDLNNYVRDKNYNSTSDNESRLLELEDVLISYHEHKKTLEHELNELFAFKDEINSSLQEKKKRFELSGGLAKQERDNLLLKIQKIETQRKQQQEQLKEFFASLYPFLLNRELMLKTMNQLNYEAEVESANILEEKFKKQKLEDLQQSLPTQTLQNEEEYQQLIESLFQLIKGPEEGVSIHHFSSSQRSIFENMVNQVNNSSFDTYSAILKQTQTNLEELKTNKETLKQNDDSGDLSKLISEIENDSQTIEKINQDIEALTNKIGEVKQLSETTESEKLKLKEIIAKEQLNQSATSLSKNIISMSEKFRYLQLQKKLQEVGTAATQMFNALARKQKFISKITISPDTYDVMLYDYDENALNKNRLSAGEKELLMLSLIWSLFHISNIKMPFVFDTLLGRLDEHHKQTMIEHYIPNCSAQVIILSTDSEISPHHHQLMKPSIANQFTLHTDEEGQLAIQQGQYFNIERIGENI